MRLRTRLPPFACSAPKTQPPPVLMHACIANTTHTPPVHGHTKIVCRACMSAGPNPFQGPGQRTWLLPIPIHHHHHYHWRLAAK